MSNENTPHRAYPLPAANHLLSDDVEVLRAALLKVDEDVQQLHSNQQSNQSDGVALGASIHDLSTVITTATSSQETRNHELQLAINREATERTRETAALNKDLQRVRLLALAGL